MTNVNIYNISGFGGFNNPYEVQCQNMLQAGVDWLEEHPKAKLKGHTYKGIYGILEPDSKDAKELSKVICDACKEGATGAMHQVVMGHLFFIAKNGVDKWKEEVKKKEVVSDE